MSVLLYRRDVLEFGAFGQLTLKWLIQDYPVNNKTKTKKFFFKSSYKYLWLELPSDKPTFIPQS